MTIWHIVTGEYPPDPGGVADYTHRLAHALADAGDEVCVWTPRRREDGTPGSSDHSSRNVCVRRLPDHFGPRGLDVLHRELGKRGRDWRLLVQYVPHMYGCRGMNVPLCAWLKFQCPVRPWVMFHEMCYPMRLGQPFKHNVLGAAQRVMASLVARAASRIFVAIPAWEAALRRLAPVRVPVVELPVPSNVALEADARDVAEARRQALEGDGIILGHFGTFGELIARDLAAVLPALLRQAERRSGLLVGRGSVTFAQSLVERHPTLRGRIRATGELTDRAVAAHLRACDVLVQPYPDGASGRRGSLMAGLALGVPAVTTFGALSEPLWKQGTLAAVVPAGDAPALVAETERLLRDGAARRRLGEQARLGYTRHFSLERTIHTLREAARETAPAPASSRHRQESEPARDLFAA
ncbi:MAG: glycosyltransferase family 4 protein [Gemmataceae bacterium]|nr:glycosyltransferase family 4 protein [Gemmataceae bacterium]